MLVTVYPCIPEMLQLPHPQQSGRDSSRKREPALVQVQARGAGGDALVAPAAHQHQVVPGLAQVCAHLYLVHELKD